MKRVKSWTLLCMAVLMLLTMTGCSDGSTVDTTLYLNRDLSGRRVMQVTLVNSVFGENFNGSVDDLSNLVVASCPPELSYTYEYVEDAYHVYTFELTFGSLDEYRQKAAALMGMASEDITLDISMPDSVWATGVRAEEGFTSIDLLQWLKNGVIDAGFVNSSNASHILGMGENTLDVEGTVYSTGSRMQVNEVEYLPINHIDLVTAVHEDGTYDRTVYIDIPQVSMSTKGSEIESYIGSCVPENATFTWETADTNSIAQISGVNLSVEELAEFTGMVFDAGENRNIILQPVSGTSPFVRAQQYSEYVDLSNYATNEYGETMIRYMLKMDRSNSEILNSYGSADWTMSEDYPEYTQVFEGSIGALDLTVILEEYNIVESIRSDLKLNSLGNVSQTTTFTLDSVVDEQEQEEILGAFEVYNIVPPEEAVQEDGAQDPIQDTAVQPDQPAEEEQSIQADGTEDAIQETEAKETETYADISTMETDGKTVISVKQTGSLEELQKGLEAMPWSQSVDFGRENSAWALKQDVAVIYDADFSGMLSRLNQEISLTVKIQSGFMSKLEDLSGNYISTGDGFELETTGTRVHLDLAGDRVNLVGVLLWMLTTGFVVCVVLVILPIVKARKVHKEAGVSDCDREAFAVLAVEEPDPSQSVGEPPCQAAAVARFCTECGSPLQPGASFCENCGAPIEDNTLATL